MSDPASTTDAVWTTRDSLYALGVFISIVSATIAGFSAFRTAKRDLNALGDSEIKTFEMIAKSEKDFAEANAAIVGRMEAHKADPQDPSTAFSLTKAESDLNDFYAQSVLNAYEIACQRFLDEKLDKERFKKTYAARLKKLCSGEAYKPFISSGDFNYSALEKVNKQLNNPEK
ncbi:hypothetical protein [Raoultella terrigena]|uniref:hypothetical protein n=1 Tax=Raoultella terrigena TaxID=577 RepID=UPI001F169247|nr:hypothetical protein [Raoultella terrigena]